MEPRFKDGTGQNFLDPARPANFKIYAGQLNSTQNLLRPIHLHLNNTNHISIHVQKLTWKDRETAKGPLGLRVKQLSYIGRQFSS